MLARLKRWWRKLRKTRPSVNVEISEELYLIYRRLAHQAGIPVEDWARRILNRSVPIAELKRISSGILHEAGLQAAFSQLDESEASQALLGERPAKKVHLPLTAGEHPCAFLSKATDLQKGYQGRCACPREDFLGRACHWLPIVAHECLAFKSRSE